jgi:hypothetical protein
VTTKRLVQRCRRRDFHVLEYVADLAQATSIPGRFGPKSSARRASPASTSNGSGGDQMRQRRLSPFEVNVVQRFHFGRDIHHFVHAAVAV